MRIIVDTSAYSAFMRGHPSVSDVVDYADELFVNPIILGELLSGFARGRLKSENTARLKEFLSSPRVRISNIDADTAEFYATIRNSLVESGNPIPINDIWIAASAMQHGLRVLSTDKHFQHVKQIVLEYVAPSH